MLTLNQMIAIRVGTDRGLPAVVLAYRRGSRIRTVPALSSEVMREFLETNLRREGEAVVSCEAGLVKLFPVVNNEDGTVAEYGLRMF